MSSFINNIQNSWWFQNVMSWIGVGFVLHAVVGVVLFWVLAYRYHKHQELQRHSRVHTSYKISFFTYVRINLEMVDILFFFGWSFYYIGCFIGWLFTKKRQESKRLPCASV